MYNVRAYRFRLKVILIIAGLGLAAVTARLFQLQVLNDEFYRGEAVKRRIRTTKTEPSRGVVYDCNGAVIARDHPSFNLAVPYKTMVNIDAATGEVLINDGPWVRSVMELTRLSHKEVIERAMGIVKRVERIRQLEVDRYVRRYRRAPPRTHRVREELAPHSIVENVPFETVARAETDLVDHADVTVEACSRRQYPLGRSAAHIIGYTAPVTAEEVERYGDVYDGSPYKAYRESDYVGRMGVEEYYNNILRGARGEIIEEITGRQTKRRRLLETPAIQGANLYLTLDKDVQAAAEAALDRQIGAFIAMEPGSGAVLALASYPRFDPNTLREDFPRLAKDPRSPLLHRAIQTLVPPGSLFKQVTSVAALETGATAPHTRYSCTGEMSLGSLRFRCWNDQGHGSLDFEEGLMKSCNCYFFHMGRAVGGPALTQWAALFRLGSKTGIDLPGEYAGLVTPPRRGSLGDVYNMSIGQGKLLVTPIQMARMIAAIANGGWLVRPHILRKITDPNGQPLQPDHPASHYREEKVPMSDERLRRLRSAYRRVVTEGTISYTKEKEFLTQAGVAGKTGTAQTADKDVNHGWFAGYAPYDDPKLVFVILAEKVPGHGGETCAPILRVFLEEYARIADRRRLASAG